MKNNQILLNKFIVLLVILCLVSCENAEQKQAILQQKIEKLKPAPIKIPIKTIVKGSIKRGHGMFQSLKRLKIDHSNSLKIINLLRDKVEFSKLKVGDKLTATFNGDKKLIGFSFSNSPAEKHILSLNSDNKWDYFFHLEKTTWESRMLTGYLRPGSTLQDDLVATGLKRSVVAEAINVLLCKVNFRLDAREGDAYKVLLNERFYNGKVLESKILYTSYSGKKAGSSEAYFYKDDEAKSIYTAHYTEAGEALIRSGLRYPVNRLHIRSGYGRRRHPVTGRITMHRGVDLRARTGSPVYAVARGVVVESSYNKYAGNKIAVRHTDRSISYYLHLSRRAVRKGDRVRSHQVIGRVGSTGRVTGPHLHFGFKKANGRWMNPMRKRMIATPKLKGEKFARLTDQIKKTKSIILQLELNKISRYVRAPIPISNI